MTFFNSKEEVIEIQLTQYGKHLLSKGKLKPVYYDFFDDDVIYDNLYTGGEKESHKDIQDRIKDGVRTHTQYTFSGLEENIKKLSQQARNNKTTFLDTYVSNATKHTVKTLPLGRSELGEQKKPAWNIRILKGQFSDTKTFITGTFSNLSYPRLTVKPPEFKIRVAEDSTNTIYVPGDKDDTVTETGFTPTSNLNDLSIRFADNTFIEVEEDYILIDLKEMNVPFEQENFEIELYSIEEDQQGEEVLKQLYFNKPKEDVVNNILLDSEPNITDFKADKTEMVETYFNIYADREIDSNILCYSLTPEERQVLVATNQLDLKCDQIYGSMPQPRRISDVTEADIGDKC